MSTMQSIKTQLQALLDNANIKTGKSHTNLTDGVNELISGYGSGGSAEIPTCTIKFVIGENGQTDGVYAYTKYENGQFSTVEVNSDGTVFESGSEFVLENVVCGSFIDFIWGYDFMSSDDGEILIDGGAKVITNSMNSVNDTTWFKAQTEPNTVSTITVQGLSCGLGGW